MPPMISEYRNGTPKATAIRGAVTGVHQATNKMALTMATPIVDVIWLRIKCGSGYGTNIDTAFKANTAIKKGGALHVNPDPCHDDSPAGGSAAPTSRGPVSGSSHGCATGLGWPEGSRPVKMR